MPRMRVGSIRPEMIYAGSTNAFKVYNGSQWAWIQDANFVAGSIVYTGQAQTFGLGITVNQGTSQQDIEYTGQLIGIRGTYNYVDYGGIIYTGQNVLLPVVKVQKGDITYTAQDVEIRGSAFDADAFDSDQFAN